MMIQIEIPVNEESAPLLQQLEITDVSWYVTLLCPLATLHTTHTTREFGSSGLQHNQAPRSNSKDQMSKAVEAAGGMVASLQ